MSNSAKVDLVRDQEQAPRSAIARLLNPRSVAIAGLSSKPGALAGIVLENLERFGFSGDVHLVHPSRDELRGLRWFDRHPIFHWGLTAWFLPFRRPASSRPFRAVPRVALAGS